MLFNSFAFVIFYTLVTAAYFALPHRFRWALLLVASCAFYMFFVPIYILILALTIVIDYVAGVRIEDTDDPRRKKTWLVMSVLSVCATLFIFKYFNFFNQNLAALAQALHWNYPIRTLRLVLPIGLSFHTFQSLSYVIEVYRGKQRAERHFGIYALYVMYFPQLVAGPIERPQNVLHQFHKPQTFSAGRLADGLLLALWGLFKKVVVADALAIYVDTVYPSSAHQTGPSLLLATYFFAFQIYCDFSGYSDIARGVSRVYGIELMKNFDAPYMATSIARFWTRWHISLSTWFRDYLYIPLGGNRVSTGRHFLNLLVVFVVSGFWHGASWNFVIWGALHGLYLIGERLFAGRRHGPSVSATARFLGTLVTFHLVALAWVFFRAPTLASAIGILRRIATARGPLFSDPIILQGILGIAAVLGYEAWLRRTSFLEDPHAFPLRQRYAQALVLWFGVVLFGIERGAQFIYFQF